MKKALSMLLCVFLLATAGAAMARESVTLVGTVTDDFRIVDENGETYDIAETEAGFDLSEYSGAMVKVSGTVEQGENGKVITVNSFELME
jgi:hypothetical protein